MQVHQVKMTRSHRLITESQKELRIVVCPQASEKKIVYNSKMSSSSAHNNKST